jgi:glycosyltransferase involved in cell wall biosynthesis
MVSICIPAYNNLPSLKACIGSILKQDHNDYEIIVTDDSQGDEIGAYLSGLSHPALRYHKNPVRLGSPANWNFAVSLAKGEFIKVMHHDDCFTTESSLRRFEESLFNEPKAGFAFCNSEVYTVYNGAVRVHKPEASQLSSLKKDPAILLAGNFIGAPSATIYRRSSLAFDEKLQWLVDVDYYIRYLRENRQFVHIPAALVRTTDGASHQVTSVSLGDAKVEISENLYVMDKIAPFGYPEKPLTRHFSELFHKFEIRTPDELRSYGPSASLQPFYKHAMASGRLRNLRKSAKLMIKSMIRNTLTRKIYRKVLNIREVRRVQRDLRAFKKSESGRRVRFELETTRSNWQTDDNTVNTGFDRHYVYHLAWAARVIREIGPAVHTDISSLLYFPAMISAFVKVDFFDYRPAPLDIDNLSSSHCDLTKLQFSDNSIQSLSCMHTVEHIGLGRYGDPIDYDGDLRAVAELRRVMMQGGNLLFVVPVGRPRIVFNAHRIYSYRQVVDLFPDFTVREFALVPDKAQHGGLIRNATEELSDRQEYGCGCFWLVKK